MGFLMISLTSWNIKGLNRTPKQNEVVEVVSGNKLCICAILESHVSISKLNSICGVVFPSWNWTSNNSVCSRGTRIIIGWDPGIVNLMVIALSDQAIHCKVRTSNGFVGDSPGVVMGDFNASLNVGDASGGPAKSTIAMHEFKECMDNLCMSDVNYSGLQITWNQRPNADTGILKKIDRILTNDRFIDIYTDAFEIFQPYRISDHAPAVLKIPIVHVSKPKPFKFSNFVTEQNDFLDTVAAGWNVDVHGYSMFKVVKKLRALKKSMRKLM
ncbi:uncharacterized protein [Rutidosis leptorrhynchoides]|uniref:uncharacterized protein n=1 Tax=Rutidosis leptorrhynchoides TaxID=125765 RepID=UPI003A9960DB